MKNNDKSCLPKGWEIKKLGEVCENLDSRRIPIAQNKRTKGNIPYYGASGIVDFVSDYIFNEDILCVSEDGANLIARTYPIAFSISGKTWVNNHAHVLRFENKMTQKFVEIYLNSIRLDDYVSGMAQPKLNQTSLNRIPIPLPPLPEQRRIVSTLDEAFSAIERSRKNAEQNLKNAKELFESYLQGVFASTSLSNHSSGSPTKREGWAEKKLGEVLIKTENADPAKIPDTEFTYLDVSSVNKETKEIETPTVLLGKDAPSRAKKLIRTGDVIFATVRPTHSRVALIPEEFDEQVCSTGYFVLRTKDIINNKLVFYFLLTKGFNEQMEQLQKGASYPAVTDNDVKGILFRFPKSKSEQQTIVHQLDALRAETQKLESIYKKKIEGLDELKKSILQKAFAGELSGVEPFEPKIDNAVTL